MKNFDPGTFTGAIAMACHRVLSSIIKKQILSWGSPMLLLLVIFMTAKPAWAQDDLSGYNQVVGSGYDQYGAYIDFTFSYYNDYGYDGRDSWIYNGWLDGKTESGQTFSIAAFHSWKQSENSQPTNYAVDMLCNSGTVRARVWEYNYNTETNGWVWIGGGDSAQVNATSQGTSTGYVDWWQHNDHNAGVDDGGGSINTDARLYVRWYVPQQYLGQNLTFFYSRDAKLSWNDASYNGQTLQGFGIVPQKVTPLSVPSLSWSFSSASANWFSVNYTYTTANQYDVNLSCDGQTQSVTAGSTPSGAFNVTMSKNPITLNLTFAAGARLAPYNSYGAYAAGYTQTQNIQIPAYIWPDTLQAVYDGKDSAMLSWNVPLPAAGENYISGDNFEIQRSTDSTFQKNVKTVATIPYDSNQPDYSVEDNLSDITGGARVYYRLRRTKSESQWAWGAARATNMQVLMDTALVVDTVTQANTSRPGAVITWRPFQGVWLLGTQFTIERTNVITNETTGINLTEQQARSGQYVDNGITYCKQYTYAVQLTLGNGYPSPAEKEIPGSILASNIGSISGLTASKGYFPDRVDLSWQTQGSFDDYIIKRKEYGSSGNYIQVATVPGAASSEMGTSDSKASPGTYYQYLVIGAVGCADTVKYSDTLNTIGFRSPTGKIYGQVTYESGQPVGGVVVRLQNDDSTQLGQSIYLDGQDSSYLVIDSLHNSPFTDSAFTIGAWIKPDDATPKSQVIFSRDGQYELGFDAAGKLYFSYGTATVTGDYLNANNTYIHVTGIHSGDSLKLMLNDSVIARMSVPFTVPGQEDKTVYIGRNKTGNHYKGYIDEMRAWNIALSDSMVAQNYTRLLTGGEKGLAAYWRFDGTIQNQFYDISYSGDNFNQNDGMMNPDDVKRSNVIPSPAQLSLKAYTDSAGNYMVTGIPYSGQGDTYTIVPLFGTHPISVNRQIAAGTASFEVDFKDKSSFEVTGYVYYRNSTVPVPGVMFKIDGNYAQGSNGDLLQTDASGKFDISVPIGFHQVQAVEANHVFVNDGKITDYLGNNLNYQGPVGPLTLYDSTTIRFIGRVAGGAVQESYPLGHSLSTNNLGKQLEIILQLPTGKKYNLYNGDNPDSVLYVDHLLPSGQADSSKIHKTRVVYDKTNDEIDIYPDSLTGEFEADLIPVKFNVTSVSATGWEDLLDGPVSLDLTNQFVKQQSVYNYEDSSQSNSGSWSYTNYSDTVFYNDAYQFIKRVIPTVSIVQLDNSGNVLDYFGDSLYQSQLLNGQKESISLINNAQTGSNRYLFAGHPVFSQGVSYHFKIEAFEQYPFYESVKNGAGVPEQVNGQDVIDKVPTTDGKVTILNSLRSGAAAPDTLSMDSTGTAYYDFTGGDPAVISPGLKDFSATVRFGQATDVNWDWFNSTEMQAFVIGGEQIGTDFVTAGPNKMLMVLRDPPGNGSYSYAEQGTTITSSTTYSASLDNVSDVNVTTHFGPKIGVWAGIGAGTVEENETVADLGVGVHLETHYTNTNTKESTTTLTTRFQTSSDPTLVGSDGDLFVGYSTNITYGQSNNLTIIKAADLKPSDTVILGPDQGNTAGYLVVKREGIDLGETFGTLFAYSQRQIEKILIPDLIKVRNTFLLPSSTADPQQIADNQNKEVYVSKLSEENINFGKSNNDPAFGSDATTKPFNDGDSYTIYFPQSSSSHTDTIMTINQYIQGWKDVMANNEKEKLNAKLFQNYSFNSGSPVDYSAQTSFSGTTSNDFNIILSGSLTGQTGFEVAGIGVDVEASTSIGTTVTGSTESSTGNESTLGFELNANAGSGEYLSVDVDKADDGGFVFRTKGGETECPFEGADTTKYYEPGTPLNQPTVQMDKPKITVDNPVANNVPATQKASFIIHLQNASDAQWSTDYVLSYGNTDDVQGATIAVDGTSLSNGRTYPINYGQTITKVLTITKGPDSMDYDNIPIILHSACQYDPTGYQQPIADTVYVSAHFVPSCSNVNIKAPDDQWILNTLSPVDQQGKRYLPVTLDQFDESNSLFNHIELQYKPSANSQWITAMSFYPDSAKYKAAQGEKAMITNAQGIHYDLEMDNATFNDQQYDIRALAVCQLGPGDFINTPSNIVTGIKDTYNPRLFGSPQPANGVLGPADEIRLNFNEPIAAGLLTPVDFQVTGIRNGAQSDSSVSVRLDGQSDYLTTEFDKNLTGKNVTVEMWILPAQAENGTLFSQGNINNSMELALTKDNHLEIMVGNNKIESDKAVNAQPGQWAHVAMEYNAKDSTVSAFYNFQQVINNVTVNSYAGSGAFEFGRSIRQQGNYYAGEMRDIRIWTKNLTAITMQTNSYTMLSGAEDGLMAYYPLSEGEGNIAYDKAHGNNAVLTGTWTTPLGKSVAFNGNGYLKISTGTIPVTSGMDYTIGLWFKAKPGQENAALVSNGKGDGTDGGGSKNLFYLGFENGLLTFENNGFKVQLDSNYLDNQWHQVAIAINRTSATGQFFVDGRLEKYFNTQGLGGIASPYMYLGARAWYDSTNLMTPHIDRYYTGNIDEFRVWNTYLNQTLINKINNTRLNGDELGLLAYYPFEKYYSYQNNQTMGFSLSDMTIQQDPKVEIPDAVAVNAVESDDMAPVKDHGPVSNLNFSYVVNNDALIINMQEPQQAIDKTIVTFKVKNVYDLQGNPLLSPVTWTAYIDQNPLSWGDDQMNLSKQLYAPMQFTSYVVNSGGSNENFRLDNLPGWLTASPSSGTIGPLGKQAITFTVDAGLNVGKYNEIIYMLNDNGESQALPVNLAVNGQAPNWKVNPADFKYNMSLYGKIRVNGIFSTNPDDMLAAFQNGKCIGVTANTYYADNDLWYAFLTLYNDSLQYAPIEFRIWNADDGQIYEAIPSVPVNFVSNSIAGTPRNPVIFDGKQLLMQDIDLNQRWNWISFDLNGPNMSSVQATLANGNWESGDIVKNNAICSGSFDQYSYTNGWIGSLPGFNNTALFMLKAANAQTLSTIGTAVDVQHTPIPLQGQQWNYISYLPQRNMTVKEALAGYEASENDVIKSQTGFAMYDDALGWVGNLTYLQPGQGYMLYRTATTDTSFTYPYLPGILRLFTNNMEGADLTWNPGLNLSRLNYLEMPVSSNFDYPDNMTVAAEVGKEFSLKPGDEILAYEGNEIRAKAIPVVAHPSSAPLFFFNISGSDAQPVYFVIQRNGKPVAQTEPVMSYRNNGIMGSLSNPFMLHFTKPLTGIKVFPNPFGDKIWILVSLASGTHRISVSIYDVDGRLVTAFPEESTNSDYYQLTWNGRNSGGMLCAPGTYFIHIAVDGMSKVYKVVKY